MTVYYSAGPGASSNRGLRRVSFVLALLLCVACGLFGQTGNGVVKGTVTDASQAAIPRAKVVLLNTNTGVSRPTESNNAGYYYFDSVPIGPYSVTVEASGFKKWTGTFTVEAGQTVTLDSRMEVGSLEATVEVSDVAPVITTEGMQVSDVKDAVRIHQLPLNGRYITNLFNLTAGVESSGNPPGGVGFRVNGLKSGSTEMLLDGVSLVDRFGGGMARVQPGLDTIQEYRIETAGSSAEFSRPATVALVTKSGTNEFHGSAFETHRNNFGGLRARQRQDSGARPPQYIRNEYGVSAGGPVIRNKTFWFAAYEGQKLRLSNFARTSVPTDAMWNGDLSNAINQAGNPYILYDPLTTGTDGRRLPFNNNIIPASRISKFSQTMHGISPGPAGPTASQNPWTGPNFEAYYPNTTDISSLTLKGDHVFSEKDNISGRFTRATYKYGLYGGRYGYPKVGSTNAGGTGRQDSNIYSQYARWNHVFSPTLLNELQLSAHRSHNSSGTLADNTNWPDMLGLPNPFGATGWPTICGDDNMPFFDQCWDADNRGDENLTSFIIENNLTKIKGKHTFKFGFRGRQEYDNVQALQQAQGSHTFGADWTSQFDPASDQAVSFTGSGFGSVLLGLPTYLSNQYNRGYYYFRQKEIGLYAQDSWRVSNRLTLDLGLRWDKWTPYKEKFNRLDNIDLYNYVGKMEVITPGNTTMEQMPGIPPGVLASWRARGLTWVTADQVGFPSSLLPADNNNFSPRLGAAYRITDKWVVRGGFGMYYWTMPLTQILTSGRTNPPLNLRFENSIADQNGKDFTYALRHVPAANDYVGVAAVDPNSLAGISSASQAFMGWDVRNWNDDRVENWNFTIERQLMSNTALRLSYIGNHGANLEQRVRWNESEAEYNYQARTGLARQTNPDLRRLNPNWNSGCCQAPIEHIGYSNSHSAQVEVERRYASGLAFQAFYNYTHSMSTTDVDAFNFGSSSINASAGGPGNTGGGTACAVPEANTILGEPSLTLDQRLRLCYFNVGAVPAHHVRWNGIYNLPFGRGGHWGRNVSGALNHVIGGWQIAFIGDWRGGLWQGVNSSRFLFGDPSIDADQRLTMNIFGLNQRLWFRGDFDPTQATSVDASKLQALVPVDRGQRISRPLGPNYDNRVPQTLADGTVRLTSMTDLVNWNARNFYRGPGAWNVDMSLFKNFQITERVKARFTADFFNAFNHPNDLAPDTTTGLQDLSRQGNDPRIIQFSLRVEW